MRKGGLERTAAILQAGDLFILPSSLPPAAPVHSLVELDRLREQLVLDYAGIVDSRPFAVSYLLAESGEPLSPRLARLSGWRWASFETRRGDPRGGYLGVLARAFVHVDSVVVLRATSPEFSLAALDELTAALGRADVVLGAGVCGGWWGWGVRLNAIGAVERVDWASSGLREALSRQCEMEHARFAEVRALRNLDSVADMDHFGLVCDESAGASASPMGKSLAILRALAQARAVGS